jgi:hypothetical protein
MTHAEPEEPIRLSPEQEQCSHDAVKWAGVGSVFECEECGAPFIMPELLEALGLARCND